MPRDDLLNQLRRNLVAAESAGLTDEAKLINKRIAEQEKASPASEIEAAAPDAPAVEKPARKATTKSTAKKTAKKG